jgi:hypothetical protein
VHANSLERTNNRKVNVGYKPDDDSLRLFEKTITNPDHQEAAVDEKCNPQHTHDDRAILHVQTSA